MGAFIIAGLVLIAALAIAMFVAFAEGMATAPHYDDSPMYISIAGVCLAAAIVATHWFPHIGW